jgi:cyclophilin family peptidyl-prolyl cis-trans isomerase
METKMTKYSSAISIRALLARGFISAAMIVGAITLAPNSASAQAKLDPNNTIYLDLKDGRVVIKLRPDLAPKHVEQVKALTKRGFYNGIVFHRVIDGFMAQTGDPTGTGMGGSDLPNIPAEFTREPYKRGSVGMARSQSPNSANSQFYLCFDGCGSLTGQYTLWGEIVSGMEFVDKVKKGAANDNGKVTNPDKIVKMQLMADAK